MRAYRPNIYTVYTGVNCWTLFCPKQPSLHSNRSKNLRNHTILQLFLNPNKNNSMVLPKGYKKGQLRKDKSTLIILNST